jgi:hypothetical protein
MEINNLLIKNDNLLSFKYDIKQQSNITWGLKKIEFIDGKISNYEEECFGCSNENTDGHGSYQGREEFKNAIETGHTIKIMETGKTNSERIYTHLGLTSFYDNFTGFFYILGKNDVIYFQATNQNFKNTNSQNHLKSRSTTSKIASTTKDYLNENDNNKGKITHRPTPQKIAKNIIQIKKKIIPVKSYDGISIINGFFIFYRDNEIYDIISP